MGYYNKLKGTRSVKKFGGMMGRRDAKEMNGGWGNEGRWWGLIFKVDHHLLRWRGAGAERRSSSSSNSSRSSFGCLLF